MIRLIYVSSATEPLGEQALVELLDQSRKRNRSLNVTGMLLYADGNFIQVLEGETVDVYAIYESILNDSRNHGNIAIEKEPIEQRDFPDWSMGFEHITEERKASIEGYTEFLQREMQPDEFACNPTEIVELLYQFKRSV
jgi:hypothetical protein